MRVHVCVRARTCVSVRLCVCASLSSFVRVRVQVLDLAENRIDNGEGMDMVL